MLLWTNGRKIYYDIVGDETAPVVCLAHALAADSGMWRCQVGDLLAAGFRVLRLDMRGHGGSDPVPGNYTMEMLAADVVEVLDRLAISKAHFCGLSIGGVIAETVALFYPKRVISLVLCDTRAHAPADAAKRWDPRKAEVQAANSMEPLADGTMGRWLTEEYKAANPGIWKQIRDTVAATTPQGYIGCASALQNFDWMPRLGEIAAPTLVLCGSDDPGSDFGENEHIAKAVQNGKFLAVDGARHLPNVEAPALFNKILIEWCTRHLDG